MSTIFRVQKTGNFTVMSNIHLKDKRLSLRAAGLLSKILSLPPEWDFTLPGLAKITSDGVDSVRSAIRELEKFGYITRRQLRDERGRMSRNEYCVYEDPKQNPEISEQSGQADNIFLCEPQAGSPSLKNPSTVTPTTSTYNKLNTKKSNTHSSITQPRAARGAADGGTEDREEIFSKISGNVESECFSDAEGVYELVELMTDVICSNRGAVRVNGGDMPLKQVKHRFLELKKSHIEQVLSTLESNANSVRNRRAYLITLLYNSPNSLPKIAPQSEKSETQTSSFDVDEVMRRIYAKYQ